MMVHVGTEGESVMKGTRRRQQRGGEGHTHVDPPSSKGLPAFQRGALRRHQMQDDSDSAEEPGPNEAVKSRQPPPQRSPSTQPEHNALMVQRLGMVRRPTKPFAALRREGD